MPIKSMLSINEQPFQVDDLIEGDARIELQKFSANSFDSIVTDPPYELGFMGKKWDGTGVAYDSLLWMECLRVLKPGGYLLAFSSARTYHRMACAIEDAGFEIRDQIMWVYGSGMAKGMDISKAIDKKAGANRKIIGKSFRHGGGINHVYGVGMGDGNIPDLTAPATELAQKWEGWNTTLKPAHEPICMARKPLECTVIDNLIRYECGGINIDGCRVPSIDFAVPVEDKRPHSSKNCYGDFGASPNEHNGSGATHPDGRWPADLILGHSPDCIEGQCVEDCPIQLMNRQTGIKRAGGYPPAGNNRSKISTFGDPSIRGERKFSNTEGYASRFFLQINPDSFIYCGKASQRERAGAKHPTIKPLKLIRYLTKLITPPEGLVLDPFIGSGTTALACIAEGFNFIGIDLDLSECNKRIDNIDVSLLN